MKHAKKYITCILSYGSSRGFRIFCDSGLSATTEDLLGDAINIRAHSPFLGDFRAVGRLRSQVNRRDHSAFVILRCVGKCETLLQ